MRMMRKAIVMAALVFVAVPAKAGILLEPYLSYETGKFDATAGSGTGKYEGTTDGVGFGARVAYTLPIFFFGVDYSTAMGKFKETTAGSTGEYDHTRSSLYALVGASLPFFRVYAGYGLMNDATVKFTGGDATFKGGGLKVGGSYTGLPFVALNLEYLMSTYSKFKTAAGEEDIATNNTFSEAKNNTVLVSVSVPFNL